MRAILERLRAARLMWRATGLEKRPSLLPRVNEVLLRQVLIHLELFPEEWDQTRWVCGTRACVAGWAVALSEDVDLRVVAHLDDEAIQTLAKELLGLTTAQAEAIFYFCASNREPATFEALCERVRLVTGIEHKVTPHLTEADFDPVPA